VSKVAITGAIPKSESMHEDDVNLTLKQDESLKNTMKKVYSKEKMRGIKAMSQQEAIDKNAWQRDSSPAASYRYTTNKAKETMKPVSTNKKKKRK
jgi:hypothetical protein